MRRADTARKQELLFATWDTNRDGFVDFSDIAEGLRKLKPSSDEIHLEFAAKAALKALPALSTHGSQRFALVIIFPQDNPPPASLYLQKKQTVLASVSSTKR